ncbi:MAG: hypothetical protein WBO04_12600 [Steroidobacteraceae bacterium]
MGGATGPGLRLEADHATFIQGGVSVVVGTRNADLVPDVVRGCGCRVARDRRRVTVLVETARCGSVLDDIAANGMIAVVFSQPSTHRTIQLKGSDARAARPTSADRAAVEKHLQAWADDMQSIGYAPGFSRAVHGVAGPGLTAIVFTPTAAFQQTPGPAAGQRLAS